MTNHFKKKKKHKKKKPAKNFGPCSNFDCTNININFRTLTKLAYEKCCMKRTIESYPYLEVGKQLCHSHYCKLVEPDRDQRGHKSKNIDNQKKKNSEPVELLSNDVIYAFIF